MPQQTITSFYLTFPLIAQGLSNGTLFPTFHVVLGFVNIPSGNTATVNLTGAAIFSSSTSFATFVSNDSTLPQVVVPINQTANSFQIGNAFATAQNFMFCCIGF